MDALTAIFGVQQHVTLGQQCARAVLLFFYGLVLLRLSGRRTFGHWSALDVILSIIVGSALGRAMTGSAPLPGTMAAAAVLAALHALLGKAVTRSGLLARIVEGGAVLLARDGRVDREACKAHMISEADLAEALRHEGLDPDGDLNNIRLVMLEPSGKISMIKRDPCKASL
ncbi:MAG: YetF domain-containing protein [Pseudomonadota bacterium]